MTVDGTVSGTDFRGIQALRTREAGYSVARKCLEVQLAAELQDPTLRSERGVRLDPDAWSWYAGTLGEIEVGRMLDTLGPDWLVLHSVPIGAKATDVDHLLIGPAGVFTLNTKHHANASVWIGDWAEKVNGTTRHYAERSLREADNVATRLGGKVSGSVVVNPLVVLVGVRGIKDARAGASRRVSFVPAADIVRWLRSLPPVLTPAELGLLHLAAEEPSTWHVDPRAADTMRVMPRFERLRADVERLGAGRPPRTTAPHQATAPAARTTWPARPSAEKPARPRATPARIVVTAVLAVLALVILAPTVTAVASVAGSDPSALGMPALVVFALIGLLMGGSTKRRRKRR